MVDLELQECFQSLQRDVADAGTWGDSARINAPGTKLTAGGSLGKL